jgi:hypothetical protein
VSADKTPNLVESAEWRNMEDFSEGIDTNRLPQTDALAGSTHTVALDDGGVATFTFLAGHRVAWSVTGEEWGGEGEESYDGVAVGEGAFWVDFSISARKVESITLVFQPVTGWALIVHSRIHDENFTTETRVMQTFHAGRVDGNTSAELPHETRELIGKRTLFRYSVNHLYEHIYLSSRRFLWHNLVGEQRGHAAAELATTWKLEKGLYVFTWREEKIPVGTVFLFDYARGRSTGKFIGLTGDGRIENSAGGAEIIEFGFSNYADHQEPV